MLQDPIVVTDLSTFDQAYTRTRGNILEANGLPRGRKGVRLASGSLVLWGRKVGAAQRWARYSDGPLDDFRLHVSHAQAGGMEFLVLPRGENPNS